MKAEPIIYQPQVGQAAWPTPMAFARRWRMRTPVVTACSMPDCSRFSMLWRKLRPTNVIERCFVEVVRRDRSMVCFVNVQSEELSPRPALLLWMRKAEFY